MQTYNTRAAISYRCALYGLIPVAGVVLGPAALFYGIKGWRSAREDPKRDGLGHAITAVILGCIETVTNSLGLLFIGIGISCMA